MSANYYELLKYAATGIASPGMTAYDKARALSLFAGGETQTLTGVPPLSFKANGNPLVSWSMLGNGQQTGTPTHDNPVMPTFCGVRTRNLFDGAKYVYTTISSVELWEYSLSYTGSVYRVPCKPSTTYTLYLAENIDITIWRIRDISTDEVPNAESSTVQVTGSYANTVPASKSTTFTTSSNAKYILFQTNGAAYASVLPVIMLVEGSTALPYEPFGYKISISCAGQTTPVYLGQVSTVRRIRKLVFDGTDGAVTLNLVDENRIVVRKSILAVNSLGLCTHLRNNAPGDEKFVIASNTIYISFKLSSVGGNTLDDVNAYFAAQYAAGHPVTIWYVLAEPETGIVNEPLMKIGDYADTLTTDTPIPTAKGSNTLTVDTTVQPSEMTIKYR